MTQHLLDCGTGGHCWLLAISESSATQIRIQIPSWLRWAGTTLAAEYCPVRCQGLLEAPCKARYKGEA